MVDASGRDHPASDHPTGVISMGSNDLHLLVATSDGVSSFAAQADHALLIELVARLDGTVLPPVALSQALAAMSALVQEAHAAGAASVTVLGTEAMREATNGSAFLALLAATFGLTAVEISGEQEAALDYCWALFPPLPHPANRADDETDPHWLVVDSGGGSTQVVLGTAPTPSWSTSLPIGAGSLTAQFLAHDPPKRKELQALAAHVAAMVDPLPHQPTPDAAVLMGGSADHLLQLTAHPQRRLLTCTDLEAALALLHGRPAAKVARIAGMSQDRARLLPAGATILLQLMQHYDITTAAVKPHGIRGGFVVCYARAGADWRRLLSIPAPTPALRPRVQATAAKARHTPQAPKTPRTSAHRRTRNAGTAD